MLGCTEGKGREGRGTEGERSEGKLCECVLILPVSASMQNTLPFVAQYNWPRGVKSLRCTMLCPQPFSFSVHMSLTAAQ